MEDQDQPGPAEAAVMLRDLTEAVAAVAGRMFDLPQPPAPEGGDRA